MTDALVADASYVSGDLNDDDILQVDETWIYTGSYQVTQDDIDAGQVTNTATVTALDPNEEEVEDISGATIGDDEPTVTPICQNPEIAIVKESDYDDGGDCSQPGELIYFTFTVTNEGNVSLSNIEVSDVLSGLSTITFIGGDSDNDDELDVTEIWIYTANYAITQTDIDSGNVGNQATAEGTAPDQSIVSDLSGQTVNDDLHTVTQLCQEPSIALIKVGTFNDENGDGCSDVDETISYVFTVINTGNVTLTDITVTDPLVTVVGGPIASLAPGASDSVTFTASYAITQADIDAGEFENQATAEGTAPDGEVVTDLSDDNSELEDDPTVIELCQSVGIALIKEYTYDDANDNGCPDVGESIFYIFLVKNMGNSELTNVTVTDPLVDVTGGPITLAPGEVDTTTFVAEYIITLEDFNASIVINQATAEGTTPEGEVVTDLSDNDSFLEDQPTIFSEFCVGQVSIATMSLEKSGVWNDENGDGSTDVGETISYSFSVTNTSTNETLYNITIEDPLPGLVIEGGPIAVLLPGETDDTTFTGTYIITQADIDNGEVVNQAIVTGEDDNGLEVTDESDDPSTEEPNDPTVVILPLVEGITFEIFNGITPNGDGYNDFFWIKGIENFPNNNVKIFNRWGILIYETDGYEEEAGGNVFTGDSDARVMIEGGRDAPTGTYFYIITFFGDGPDDNPGKRGYSGYLYINR